MSDQDDDGQRDALLLKLLKAAPAAPPTRDRGERKPTWDRVDSSPP
jgi:hypothetical protein